MKLDRKACEKGHLIAGSIDTIVARMEYNSDSGTFEYTGDTDLDTQQSQVKNGKQLFVCEEGCPVWAKVLEE